MTWILEFLDGERVIIDLEMKVNKRLLKFQDVTFKKYKNINNKYVFYKELKDEKSL